MTSRHPIRPTLCRVVSFGILFAGWTLVFGDEPTESVTPIPLVEIESKEPIFFDRDVYPILESKCTTCHDREGGLAEGELDLLTVASITKGGKGGAGLIADKGEESLIFLRGGHRKLPVMPPKDEGEPLTSEELSILKAWIDQGAKPGEILEPAKASMRKVELSSLPSGFQPAAAVDLTEDGAWLVAGIGSSIALFDTKTGQLINRWTIPGDVIQAVQISPDRQWLAAGRFERVELRRQAEPLDGSTWSEPVELSPIEERPLAIAFSPDNALLAVGAGVPSANGEITLWSLENHSLVRRFELAHSDSVAAVAFRPDGERLASGSADKFVKIHAVSTGELVHSMEGHTEGVTGVAWKMDGKILVSSSADKTLKRWDAETGEQARTIGQHGREVTAVRMVGDTDQAITSCGDRLVRLINTTNDQVVRAFEGSEDYLLCVDVSKDGAIVAGGAQNGVVYVWNGADAKLLHKLQLPSTDQASD